MKLKRKKKGTARSSKRPEVIMAVDASINGTCIWICDDNFKPIHWFLFTTKKFIADCSPENTHRVTNKGYERTVIAQKIFEDLLTVYCPNYIVFEEYALRASGLVFNIAEFTGALKLSAYKHCRRRKNCRMRTVVPSVNKKWATGNGSADKEWMVKAASGDTDGINPSLKMNCMNYLSLPEKIQEQHDVADAYCLANFFMFELQVRRGRTSVESLKRMYGIHAECFFPKSKKKKKRLAPHLQPWIS